MSQKSNENQPQFIKCHSEECNNSEAKIGEICGALIPEEFGYDNKYCDIINYQKLTWVYTIKVTFLISDNKLNDILLFFNEDENEDYCELTWDEVGKVSNGAFEDSFPEEIRSFIAQVETSFTNSDFFRAMTYSDEEKYFDELVRLDSAFISIFEQTLNLEIFISGYSHYIQHDWFAWGPKDLADGILRDNSILLKIFDMEFKPNEVFPEY